MVRTSNGFEIAEADCSFAARANSSAPASPATSAFNIANPLRDANSRNWARREAFSLA